MTLLGWLTAGARDHAPELLLSILLATAVFAALVRIIDPGDP